MVFFFFFLPFGQIKLKKKIGSSTFNGEIIYAILVLFDVEFQIRFFQRAHGDEIYSVVQEARLV